MGGGVFAALVVDELGGMESKNGLPGGADALERNRAQHQRAGGKAGPVDDDPLAGSIERFKKRQIGSRLAARTGQDSHLAGCWRLTDQEQDRGDGCAWHRKT